MRAFYLWPHRRPTYRVIETRDTHSPWRIQRRWRWLWFEFWKTLSDGLGMAETFWSEAEAHQHIAKLERMDGVR